MNPFIKLYRNLGLISTTSHGLPIHRVCLNKEKCWDGALDRTPPDGEDWSQISQPWVGPEYSKLRLAAIGENLNEYGGLNALTELTEEAKGLIGNGYRRVRFKAEFDQYAGSFLWHRLGCYSAVIGESFGGTSLTWSDDGYPLAEDVSQAFDLIAFIEHIKCSPTREKNNPTAAMWKYCGGHILRHELIILKPAHLLVLGISNSPWFIENHVLDSGLKNRRQIGSVAWAEGKLGGNSVKVWIVPHPQSYGGASKTILADLRKALQLNPEKK